MDNLGLTVIEDRDNLDDVEASVVREHFETWAETAPAREQGILLPETVWGARSAIFTASWSMQRFWNQ